MIYGFRILSQNRTSANGANKIPVRFRPVPLQAGPVIVVIEPSRKRAVPTCFISVSRTRNAFLKYVSPHLGFMASSVVCLEWFPFEGEKTNETVGRQTASNSGII